jgi:hypothetical protein
MFDPAPWPPNEVVLIRNLAHPAWGHPSAGNIQRVRFIVFPTQADAVSALISTPPSVDVVPTITDPIQQDRIPTTVDSKALHPLNTHYLGFRTDLPPVNSASVRRWIRDRLDIPALLNKAGIPPDWRADTMLPPTVPGAKPLPHGSPGNPPGAIEVTLLFNASNPLDANVAVAVKQEAAARGVTVRFPDPPLKTYRELIQAIEEGRGQLFLYNWYIDEPEAERLLEPLFHSRRIGTLNLTRYRDADPQIDALMARTTARSARAAANQIAQDTPAIPLYHVERIIAWTGISHFRPIVNTGNAKDQLVTVTIP